MYPESVFADPDPDRLVAPASRALSALSDTRLRDIGLRRDELRGLALRARRDSLRQTVDVLLARRPHDAAVGTPARA
jgi:hypothetical protein